MKQTPAHNICNGDLLAYMPRDCRRVVEVGCSTGALARAYLAENPGCDYVEIEIDADYAEVAREACREVIAADVETMPDDQFAEIFSSDCIVFGDTLEHLRDPWKTLQRIRPLLQGGARIVACIPNAQHWSIQARLSCGAFRYEDNGLLDRTHLRWFTRVTMFEMFQSCGYRVTEGKSRIFPEPDRDRFLPAIQALAQAMGADPAQAAQDATALQYVVVAMPAN